MTVLYIEDTLLQELEQLKAALRERDALIVKKDAIIVEKDAIIDAITEENDALITEKDELEKLNGRIKLHVRFCIIRYTYMIIVQREGRMSPLGHKCAPETLFRCK